MPEVIEDGVTGFVVETVDDAVEALGRLGDLSRATCRREFERQFTSERMARDYVAAYRSMLGTPALAARAAMRRQTAAE